jgi:hypothetical protein
MIKINPIYMSNCFQPQFSMGMICIPKDFLEYNSLKNLHTLLTNKNICNKESNWSESKYNINMIKDNNLIIINDNKNLNMESNSDIIEIIISDAKKLFNLDSPHKYIKNNLFVFIIKETEIKRFHFNQLVLDKTTISECINLIYEQYRVLLEKRTSTMIVKNYLEYRYNPTYGFCQYIINKQFDELEQEKKRIKLN